MDQTVAIAFHFDGDKFSTMVLQGLQHGGKVLLCFLVVQRFVLRLFTEKIVAASHHTEIDTIRTELCTENEALVAHVLQGVN